MKEKACYITQVMIYIQVSKKGPTAQRAKTYTIAIIIKIRIKVLSMCNDNNYYTCG